MRTDAKIGFAIVGVLVAVLAVYAVVIPRHKRVADTNASPLTVKVPTDPPATVTPPSAPAGDPVGTPDPDQVPVAPGPAMPGRPAEGPGGRSILPAGHDDHAGGTVPPLVTGDLPRMPFDPPSVPGIGGSLPGGHDAATAAGSGGTVPPRSGRTGPRGRRTADPSDAVATVVGGSDHPYTIRPGQTLSSIAAEVYGDSRAWKQIAKENPKVNPSRLKVGTRIMIPDPALVRPHPGVVIPASDVIVSDEPETAAVAGQATYRVQPGDSLYKIAKRVLGSGRRADTLYDLNRVAIGPDMTRLKQGMVLRLPSASDTLSADISR